MTNSVQITVPANADLDDCLQGAADAYVAEHPELAGWDLSPEWTDEDTRETVTLTIPSWVCRWAFVDSESRISDLFGSRASADDANWGHTRELVQLITAHEVGDVIEYGSDGVELVPVDSLSLYDSDSADYLSADDLGLTDEQYVQACRESRDCGQAEGHIVLTSGRRVYASE